MRTGRRWLKLRKRNCTDDRKTAHSLINAPDDLYLQTKAMYVWWMLKDMLANPSLGFLLNYHASEDKDGNYMQRVIEKETQRDLQWFFDDWVYRDRGLPDFRVDSVYPRPIVDGGYMVTVTIENLGKRWSGGASNLANGERRNYEAA